MIFYPHLFETKQEKDDISLPSGKPLKELIGTKNAKIKGNKIIKAGGKNNDDPITWEYIKSQSKRNTILGDLLKNFVLNQMLQKGESISEDLINRAFNSKYEDTTIKDLPSINLKFEDFWNVRIQEYFENPSIVSPAKKKKKEELSVFIPTEIYSFFRDHGKRKALEEFRSSIPLNSSFISQMNTMFEFIKKLIQSSEGETIMTPKIGDSPQEELTSKKKEQFKMDMISYISAYENLDEFIKSGVYEEKIIGTEKLTFLKLLFNIDSPGVEKGQAFLAYCVQNTDIDSGIQAYDIIIDNDKTYQVKNYIDEEYYKSISIEAKDYISKFSLWINVKNTFKYAEDVFNKIGESNLKDVLSDYFFETWKSIANNNSKEKIDNFDILNLKIWYHLSHNLNPEDFSKEEKEKYTMATLKGSGIRNRDILIEPLDPDKIDNVNNIKLSGKENVEGLIQKLRSIKYVRDPQSFSDDLVSIKEMYFKDHSDVDYFLIFRPNEINKVNIDDLIYTEVTPSEIKVIEEKYAKRSEKTKSEYNKSKKEIQKAREKGDPEEEALRQVLKNISYEDFFTKGKANESLNLNFYPYLYD